MTIADNILSFYVIRELNPNRGNQNRDAEEKCCCNDNGNIRLECSGKVLRASKFVAQTRKIEDCPDQSERRESRKFYEGAYEPEQPPNPGIYWLASSSVPNKKIEIRHAET